MRGCVESFLEVQNKSINLPAFIQDFNQVVYNCDQLSFTAMLLPECMLSIWQEFMFIQVCHNIWANNMFEQFAWYAGGTGGGLGYVRFCCHIRKLTVKFLCLFQLWLCQAAVLSPLQRWDTLSVFLLTINVPVEVSGISLNITNQVGYTQIMLLLSISLNFPFQRFKFCP